MPHQGNGRTAQQRAAEAKRRITQTTQHGLESYGTAVRDWPVSSVATAFGVGFGVGLLIGLAIGEEQQPETWRDRYSHSADKLGRQIVESLASMTPKSISRLTS